MSRSHCTGCRWSTLTTYVCPSDHDRRVRRYACGHARALDGVPVLVQIELRGERYVGSTDDAPEWCPLVAQASHPLLGPD